MKSSQEKIEYNKNYYIKNKSRMRSNALIYYIKNKASLQKYSRDYYRQNKNSPEFISKKKQWLRKSYIKNRDHSLEWQRNYWKKIRFETLNFLGGVICSKCGFNDWRALCIDHVYGDGNRDRKENKISNAKKYLEHIKKNKSNYQILCSNCNCIKKHENKEFPKKKY